jgi:ribosomal protein S3AE
MNDESKKKPIGILSIDAKLLYNRLIKVEIDEIITYEELSKVINRNVKIDRHVLDTARKKTEIDDNIVFEVIRGKGYKRLDNTEKAESLEKYNRSIKRTINRASRRASTVDFDQLTMEGKNKFKMYVSCMAAMKHFTKGPIQKKIKNKIEEKENQLSLSEILQSSIGDDIKEEFEKDKRID